HAHLRGQDLSPRGSDGSLCDLADHGPDPGGDRGPVRDPRHPGSDRAVFPALIWRCGSTDRHRARKDGLDDVRGELGESLWIFGVDRDDRLRCNRSDHIGNLPFGHVAARVVLGPTELEEPDPVRDRPLDLVVLLDWLALRMDECAPRDRLDVDQLRHRREVQLYDELVLVFSDIVRGYDAVSQLGEEVLLPGLLPME